MRFTPVKKEDWLRSIKLNKEYQHFSDSQLSVFYEQMVEEATKGMVAASALGGKWTQGVPDYSLLETVKKEDLPKKMDNLLNATTEELIQVFGEVYGEYEKNIRAMFVDSSTNLSITPQQIVEALHKRGLSKCATQIYILFGGIYIGCAHDVKSVIQTVKGLVAAYRMADELGVDVSEIEPQKALEYYNTKRS